jgi:hypothetical protein
MKTTQQLRSDELKEKYGTAPTPPLTYKWKYACLYCEDIFITAGSFVSHVRWKHPNQTV